MNILAKIFDLKAANARIAELEKEKATFNATIEGVRVELGDAKAKLEAALAECESFRAKLAESDARVSSAEAKAAEIVASQGVPLKSLPDSKPVAGARMSRAAFGNLSPSEQFNFVRSGGRISEN